MQAKWKEMRPKTSLLGFVRVGPKGARARTKSETETRFAKCGPTTKANGLRPKTSQVGFYVGLMQTNVRKSAEMHGNAKENASKIEGNATKNLTTRVC